MLPKTSHDIHILDVSMSHTATHHSQKDFSGWVISSSQRPVPDNTQHSQQTRFHAPVGFKPTISAAADRAATGMGSSVYTGMGSSVYTGMGSSVYTGMGSSVYTGMGSSVYSPPFTSNVLLVTLLFKTHFKMERILNICIFSQLCIWDCLHFAIWHHVTGCSVPNALKQVNGLQSSEDDYTLTQLHISEERKILCICMHKGNCGVQLITACPIDWCNFYYYSAVTVKDHVNKWPINTTSVLGCIR